MPGDGSSAGGASVDGCRVIGFTVHGGFRVHGGGFRVHGGGFRVHGGGFRVHGAWSLCSTGLSSAGGGESLGLVRDGGGRRVRCWGETISVKLTSG